MHDPDRRVLILAPTGQDSPVLASLLSEAGVDGVIVGSMPELIADAGAGAGAAIIAYEALNQPVIELLGDYLSRQPLWSKIPIVVVTWKGSGGTATALSTIEKYVAGAHLVIIERPFTIELIQTTIRFALQFREAQCRTRELTRRLEEQSEELKRNNRDLEQFTAMASHDLQEPVRIGQIYLDLLTRKSADALDERAKSYIGNAQKAMERMSGLIQSLLRLSIAQQGSLALSAVNAKDLVEASLENLGVRIREANALITIEDLPAIQADAILMTQVFQNIIGNALKFSGGCRPVISISAKREGDSCIFRIDDNGVGIAPQSRERIFEIFHRSEATAKCPGSGIGLALCRRIVERHGGRIGVEPLPGQGSRFWFSAPAAG